MAFGTKAIINTVRPKMTAHRGRTWDVTDVTLPDGSKTTGHLDTTWGHYVYFENNKKWYRVPIPTHLDFYWGVDLSDKEVIDDMIETLEINMRTR